MLMELFIQENLKDFSSMALDEKSSLTVTSMKDNTDMISFMVKEHTYLLTDLCIQDNLLRELNLEKENGYKIEKFRFAISLKDSFKII